VGKFWNKLLKIPKNTEKNLKNIKKILHIPYMAEKAK
jgi:hypothetical protein